MNPHSALRRPPIAALLFVAAALTAPSAWAGGTGCPISATDINFGTYDVFNSTDLVTTGTITISCGGGQNVSNATLTLSTGTSGDYAQRKMSHDFGGTVGNQNLNYNLFHDANHTQIWGQCSTVNPGTVCENIASLATTGNYTVYAQMPSGQNAYVTSSSVTYTDSITVTLTY